MTLEIRWLHAYTYKMFSLSMGAPAGGATFLYGPLRASSQFKGRLIMARPNRIMAVRTVSMKNESIISSISRSGKLAFASALAILTVVSPSAPDHFLDPHLNGLNLSAFQNIFFVEALQPSSRVLYGI